MMWAAQELFNESSRGIESEQEEIELFKLRAFLSWKKTPTHLKNYLNRHKMTPWKKSQRMLKYLEGRPVGEKTKRPYYYGVRLYTVPELKKEPETVADTLKSFDKAQWTVAI